ncbi:MAG: flagellar biosynthetic protein FliO [Azoarcus sp.]|jgi:flagellar protein FliO/FliZ|nr:flagellar biosynthetic protein FliO [Azoarcus sp.]
MKLPPVFFLSVLLPALAAFALFPAYCQAAAEASASTAIPDPLAGFGQMLFGLVLVLGILAGCVWLLKRFSSPVRGNGLLRILGVTAVGPREKVVLLEVGEKILMLGVTPNNVRALHVFEHGELPLVPMPVAPCANPGPASATALVNSFASRLAQALKGRRDAD